MKAIPTSKRSIKKRLTSEIKKLLPEAAVFIRKPTGFVQPSALEGHDWHVYGNWTVYIGRKHWGVIRIKTSGIIIDSWSHTDLLKEIKYFLQDKKLIPELW